MRVSRTLINALTVTVLLIVFGISILSQEQMNPAEHSKDHAYKTDEEKKRSETNKSAKAQPTPQNHDEHAQSKADKSRTQQDEKDSHPKKVEDKNHGQHQHDHSVDADKEPSSKDKRSMNFSMRSMSQMGSGTAWQPASSPTNMWHKTLGDWLVMYHLEAKIGVNGQGGPRGRMRFESQNWFMPMASRKLGRGNLTLRGMFSLEPLTFAGAGSPQLFQTGEVYKGKAIIDAQHPHDLVMELSAKYEMPLGEKASFFAYVGLPGEPALGPVAFMHRTSASENPSAPLGHHLQDATHITYGVATAGFTYKWFKFEASVFNGREPDENRYNIETGKWNSRSFRISFAPSKNWTAQFSHGLLKNPEILHAGDTARTTASVQYNKPLHRGNWATSLVWGRNREEHRASKEVFKLNSYLLESTLNFVDKNYLYTRLELVDKKDLLRREDLIKLGFDPNFHHPQFRIGAYTAGYARDIWNTDKISLAVGGDVTFYSKPEILNRIYGDNPISYKFFFRIRPAAKKTNHQGH